MNRILPFAGLIREDSFERPLVVLTGSAYVTAGNDRRSSGTHYTPPTLTEPIVQHTLEPLVYQGPADGLPREQWTLKSPKDILDLKVCDMAMGSGAFLVQVCRYLAERLVESWENEEKRHPGKVLITPDGKFSEGSASERLVPAEAVERIAIARRVVADRCLYGVDINPMAVEMAKLSLWLITVDANRPFTFLDHAFKCGDSLLGITSLEQLERFSLRHDAGKLQGFNAPGFSRHIEEAKNKREGLEAMPSDTPEQIAAKAALYAEAEEAVSKLKAAADLLVAMELNGLKGRAYEGNREACSEQLVKYWGKEIGDLQSYAESKLGSRQCLHWVLAFPEAIARGGFDALVGNPPFLGGKRISPTMGDEYRAYLLSIIAEDRKGSADYCAYFMLRNHSLAKANAIIGLIVTNSIAEGDTREVGLDHLNKNSDSVIRANPNIAWPGEAVVIVSQIWISKTPWGGQRWIDGRLCGTINSFLDDTKCLSEKPLCWRLKALKNVVHFVADVHQPLHAGFLDDKGGNNFQLRAFMRGSNLHAVWDTGLIKNLNEDSNDLTSRLRARPKSAAVDLNVVTAAEESCRIVGMPGFYPERIVSGAYIERFTPLMEERLITAGARLAGLLNRVFQ